MKTREGTELKRLQELSQLSARLSELDVATAKAAILTVGHLAGRTPEEMAGSILRVLVGTAGLAAVRKTVRRTCRQTKEPFADTLLEVAARIKAASGPLDRLPTGKR